MNVLLFSVLFLLTVMFYMLEISFKSFSRISLAGFLDDFDGSKPNNLDMVSRYDMVMNALGGFTFF
ncbi:MAG: hypothetical protein GY765_30285, partial [bacterium]|nr:hypothetical protein [bacterium]